LKQKANYGLTAEEFCFLIAFQYGSKDSKPCLTV